MSISQDITNTLKMTCSVIVVVFMFLCPEVFAKRKEIYKISSLREEPTIRIKTPATPGCVFGDQFYSLEEKWHPELIQSGKLFCVICQCKPNVKKGVLKKKGHVTCRDIKHECPLVECNNPVLLPDQCCKTCPTGSFPMPRRIDQHRYTQLSEVPQPNSNTTSSSTGYMAVLTGHSPITTVTTSAIGAGYFSVEGKSFVYSIDTVRLKKVRSLSITDDHGTVFHTVKLKGDSNPICGSSEWPSVFFEFLRDEKLFVKIHTKKKKNGEIAGQIKIKDDLASDAYSAILEPQGSRGQGAVVLIGQTENSRTLEVTAYGGQGGNSINQSVTFTVKKNKKTIHTETTYSQSQQNNASSVSWKWERVRERTFEHLIRERLSLSMEIHGGITFSGKITVRKTCNDYWGLLAPPRQIAPTHGGGAMVWLQLQKKGRMLYKVNLAGTQNTAKSMSLAVEGNHHDPFCKINIDNSQRQSSNDNSLRGRCKNVPASAISALYTNHLEVRLETTDRFQPRLEGVVQMIPYNGNIKDTQDEPILLTGSAIEPMVETSAVGQVWMSLSDSCHLYYQLLTKGLQLSGNQPAQLVVQALGGATVESLTLGLVTQNLIKGSIKSLPEYFYNDFQKGDIRVIVTSETYPDGEIGTKIRLRNKCTRDLSHQEAIRTNRLPILERGLIRDDPGGLTSTPKGCRHQDRFYSEGEMWIPSNNECSMCFCRRGNVECQSALCPKPNCDKPVNVTGDCCPQCKDDIKTTDTCYYDGDRKQHIKGTVWHPFAFPFGYMSCAVCTCSEHGSQVNCTRVTCPKLECLAHEAVYKVRGDCCRTCPEPEPIIIPEIVNDVDDTDACMFRGFKHFNGTSWHPNVQPFGVMHCVTCSCMNGQTTCVRQRCPPRTCDKHLYKRRQSECCPVCTGRGRKGSRRSRRRSHDS